MHIARRRLSLLLAGALLLTGCSKEAPPVQTEQTAEVTEAHTHFASEDAAKLLEDYLQACTQDTPDASAVFLMQDNRRFEPLLSCKVWSQQQLNEHLWVFVVQQQTARMLLSGSLFVGAVEDRLYVFPTVTDLPVELRTGFRWEDYVIPEEPDAEPEETEAAAEEAEETEPEEETTEETEEEATEVTEETAAPTEEPAAPVGGGSGGGGAPGTIPPGEHDLKVTTVYDCIQGGYKHYKCRHCDWEFTVTVAPKGKHTMLSENRIVTYPYGCDFDGNFTWKCTECAYTEQGVVPAPGHNWIVEKVFPPTESSAGYTRYRCTNCHARRESDFVTLTPETEPPETQPPATVPPDTQPTQPPETQPPDTQPTQPPEAQAVYRYRRNQQWTKNSEL